MDELQHYALKQYREQKNPRVMQEAFDYLTAQIGPEEVEKTLRRFVQEFPPVAVYRGEITAEEYLRGETGGTPHHQIELEEMLMLWLANQNPAFEPYRELFDDTPLRQETAYPLVMTGMREFFAAQPTFGLDNQNLIDFLRLPALSSPDSLLAQLEFMRGRWGITLGQYLYRVLGGLDFIREEEKAIFTGPGPTLIPVFGEEGQRASMALFGPSGRQQLRFRAGARTLQPRSRLDAAPRVDRQEHLRLARSTLEEISTRHHAARSDPRRRTGSAAAQRLYGPVADRVVGAQPRLAEHQADDGQSRSGRLGLFADGLSHRR